MDAAEALRGAVVALILVLANGFFVAAEYSFVRVRGTQLQELAKAGSARAKLGAHISGRLDAYISAAQLGVTLASLAIGWIGEPAVAALVEPLFRWLPEPVFHVIAFVLAFGAITYVHIVVGELAPKYLALQRAVQLALLCAYPLDLFYRVMFPFIWFVNNSANTLLRWIGIKPRSDLNVHSDEELKMLIAASARQGVLQESERVIVGNALDFADTLVRQVMVPRTEIVAVPEEVDLAGLVVMARQHRLSRFPVYRDDLDHIVGVVHVKDLVGVDRTSKAKAHDIMRRVPAIPETLRLDQALAEFRRQHAQLAIVIDEYGGTAGLVTLEDVLEELVGEVGDEFEKDASPPIREEAPGVYLVDGLVGLAELRERLHLGLTDEPYDTVGGMVFGRLGRLAKVGDAVDVEGYRFQVTGVDGRRVSQVRIQRSRAPKKTS
ncbi:MAG: hemolysin family protein [Chloroflexota bacterium]|nr:hemolysin family protein [Chloroflexota bacterium]